MPAAPSLPVRLSARAQAINGKLIARIALRYQGAGYVYGGNASGVGNWDCSSFVSYILHLCGLSLPDGKWGAPGMPPNSHGPVVVDYADWAGATTVGVPQAGDLCCWVGEGPDGHIGIAISATEMISALDPFDGTKVTPIVGTGPSTAPLIYRRVNGLAGGGPVVVTGTGPGRGLGAGVAMVAALFAGAGLLAVGVVAAGVAGTVWVIGKTHR
jgi:cell wall-associated NlpC family hydrolase